MVVPPLPPVLVTTLVSAAPDVPAAAPSFPSMTPPLPPGVVETQMFDMHAKPLSQV
jgi:hypothetical protein